MKAHLQYLVMAGLMYGIKAVLYFIIAYIPCNPVTFGNPATGVYAMAIDNAIPLVPEFYFFYVLYYVLPEIFLWILSFYDKKKTTTIIIATVSATILACICYLIQQVKMIRPEAYVAQYRDFSNVHNLREFFLHFIDWQYRADETALKVKSVTENILNLRGEKAVSIQSFASMASTYTSILNVVTLVVTMIAAISLVVGGIGVMNIMTVTVTERTREIGIRKSLGARTSYILIQFLTESAVITLLGGMLGMLMGFLFTKVVGNFMSFPPVISPMNVLLVVAISVADGLFFGIYPARKAAKMDPIEALRQE